MAVQLPAPGTLAAEKAADTPEVHLSRDERRVLELHDELRELEIKIAMLKAQQNYRPDRTKPDTDENLKIAQEEAGKAKASWLLRNDICDSVLTANPIIKAVHGSIQITPIESDLFPQIQARDQASSTLARSAMALRTTLNDLTEVEAATSRVARQNADLGAELLQLAEQDERRRKGGIDDEQSLDAHLREKTSALRDEVKTSRQKWKVTKGTVSAVVVGSGVNWVDDEHLRWMVLDPEEDA